MNDAAYNELALLIKHYPELESCKDDIIASFHVITDCYKSGGLIMICGNGGSAADSSHIVGELMKGFKKKRALTTKQRHAIETFYPGEGAELADSLQRAIPAISLVEQSALSSAFINDVNPEMVYAQQVFGYGKTGDVLMGLSTSGNSQNVVNACKVAKTLGVKTIAFTGREGGCLSDICDITLRAPATEVYRVQEYHLPIYHALCAMLEAELMDDDS